MSEESSEEWQDVLGTGGILRKVLVEGHDTDDNEVLNMQRRFVAIIDIETRLKDSSELIPSESHTDFTVTTDADIFPAVNLAIPLMNIGETSQFIFEPRFTYGQTGNPPAIPPYTKLDCLITLKQKYPQDLYVDEYLPKLSLMERLEQANRKKERGNFWHARQEYVNAIDAYNSAAGYLEEALSEEDLLKYASMIDNHDENPTTDEDKCKLQMARCLVACKNNLAATYIKTKSLKNALQHVDRVLEIQPANVKALFRKSNILEGLHEYDDAIATLRQLLTIDASNKAASDRLNTLVRKQKEESEKIRALYKRMIDPDAGKNSDRFSSNGGDGDNKSGSVNNNNRVGSRRLANSTTTLQGKKVPTRLYNWTSSTVAKLSVVGAAILAGLMAVIYTNYLAV